ncbi:fimbrial protein [Atlantibacter hermannii]|uniref:fimbrial protein n=1 Tax=Atlantibacter hermannii TaxID=565 RepID=UPI0034D6A59B
MKNKMSNVLKFFAIFLFLKAGSAFAVITCYSNTVRTFTTTLNSTISASADLPVGSVIYSATLGSAWTDSLVCDANWSLTMKYKTKDTGDSWRLSNPPYSPGDYYPTSVPGIGYMLVAPSGATGTKNTVTGATPLTDNTWGNTAGNGRSYGMRIYVILIKTALGPASGSINASTFHSVKYYAPPATGYAFKPGPGNDGDGLTLAVFNFLGNINVQAPACEVDNQKVRIGEHIISQEMKTVGSTTSWYDASVMLKNCANFTGYYSTDSTGQFTNGSGTASGGTLQQNLFSISVNAVSGATSQGYITLTDPVGNANQAATGYALQLGYTPDNINASPTQPTKIWKPGDNWTIPVPFNASGTLKIPLAARLIRTQQSVTPGPADAKVVVSISYK